VSNYTALLGSDKVQQVLTLGCTLGIKFAVYSCLAAVEPAMLCWRRCLCWASFFLYSVSATHGQRRSSSDRRFARSYRRVPTSRTSTNTASPSTEIL